MEDAAKKAAEAGKHRVKIACPKCRAIEYEDEDKSGYRSCFFCGARFHYTTRPSARQELRIGVAVLLAAALCLWPGWGGASAIWLFTVAVAALLILWVAGKVIKENAQHLRDQGSEGRLPGTRFIDGLRAAFVAIAFAGIAVLGLETYLEGLGDRAGVTVADLEEIHAGIGGFRALMTRISGLLLWGSILAGLLLLWLRQDKVWDRLERGRKKFGKGVKFATLAGLCIASFSATGVLAADHSLFDLDMRYRYQSEGARAAHASAYRDLLREIAERAANEALRRLESEPACAAAVENGVCDPVRALHRATTELDTLRDLYAIDSLRAALGPDATRLPAVESADSANREMSSFADPRRLEQVPVGGRAEDIPVRGVTLLRDTPRAGDEDAARGRLVDMILSVVTAGMPFSLPESADAIVGPLARSLLNRIPDAFMARVTALASEALVEAARGCARRPGQCGEERERAIGRAGRDPRFRASAADLAGPLAEGSRPMLQAAAEARIALEPARQRLARLSAACAGHSALACADLRDYRAIQYAPSYDSRQRAAETVRAQEARRRQAETQRARPGSFGRR